MYSEYFTNSSDLSQTQCRRYLAIKVLLMHNTRVSKLLDASLHRPRPQKVNIFIFSYKFGYIQLCFKSFLTTPSPTQCFKRSLHAVIRSKTQSEAIQNDLVPYSGLSGTIYKLCWASFTPQNAYFALFTSFLVHFWWENRVFWLLQALFEEFLDYLKPQVHVDAHLLALICLLCSAQSSESILVPVGIHL